MLGLTAGIACCVLRFSIRNWIQIGKPVLITAHGGINFYVGNNENASGFYTAPKGMPFLPGAFNLKIPRQVAEAQTQRSPMSDSEVSAYWFGQGMAFIKQHPQQFRKLVVKKASGYSNAYKIPLNIDFYFLRKLSFSLKLIFVPFGVVLPLGIIGMILAMRQWRTHLIFCLYFLTYAFSVIIFFIMARYRLPVVTVLLLYSGFAIRTMIAHLATPSRLGILFLWAGHPAPLGQLATGISGG